MYTNITDAQKYIFFGFKNCIIYFFITIIINIDIYGWISIYILINIYKAICILINTYIHDLYILINLQWLSLLNIIIVVNNKYINTYFSAYTYYKDQYINIYIDDIY